MKQNEYNLLNTWLDNLYYYFTHDNNNSEIPNERLISLKELATFIQTVYRDFKEEYRTLEKLDIGENNNVLCYNNDGNNRILYMQINKQGEKTIVPKGHRYLTIRCFNGEYKLSFTNAETFSDERKIITIKNIDSRILSGYLDLFEKYYPIFKLYYDLHRNNSLASNGNQYLNMMMDTTNNSLINGLNGIEFNIQNFSFMGDSFVIRLYVDLTNGVNIDYNKSKIIVNDSMKKANGFGYKEILNRAFENIRFNRSSLEDSKFIEYAVSQDKQEQEKVKKIAL